MNEQELINARKWDLLALVWGYNELAKMVETLGEKVYLRLARDAYEREYVKMGGEIMKEPPGKAVLVLSEKPPFIEFTARDIELMREAVRKFDEENSK